MTYAEMENLAFSHMLQSAASGHGGKLLNSSLKGDVLRKRIRPALTARLGQFMHARLNCLAFTPSASLQSSHSLQH